MESRTIWVSLCLRLCALGSTSEGLWLLPVLMSLTPMSGVWSAKMVTNKYSHLYRHMPVKSSRLHLGWLCGLCWPRLCDRSDSCCLSSRPRPQETKQLLLSLLLGTLSYYVMKLSYSGGHTACKEESNPIISMNQHMCKQTTMYHQAPEECSHISEPTWHHVEQKTWISWAQPTHKTLINYSYYFKPLSL